MLTVQQTVNNKNRMDFKKNAIFIFKIIVKNTDMFSKSLLVYFIFILIMISCVDQNKGKETSKNEETKQKSLDSTKVSLKEAKKIVKVIDKKTEKTEVHEKIVAKYGEQWDFCNCVVKNDSINTALEKTLTDKQTDKLMTRWEYVDMKCKEFLTNPNTTPEQRAKHEWKVKQCLKNAK